MKYNLVHVAPVLDCRFSISQLCTCKIALQQLKAEFVKEQLPIFETWKHHYEQITMEDLLSL